MRPPGSTNSRRRWIRPGGGVRTAHAFPIFIAALALATFMAGQPRAALAHGDTHEQIDELTRQISAHTRAAALYVKRGELHRLHRDWEAAQADFNRAAQLDPQLPIVDLLRGKLLLEAGQPRSAKPFLDRFLDARPDHVDALILRARMFGKLGDALSAVRDFSRAIDHAAEPKPDYFLERAQMLRTDPKRPAEALRGLDEGIKRLGPIVTLELPAIELELGAGNYDGALARVALLAAQSPRQEAWLARRGEILLEANRPAEARTAFSEALAAIETLPPRPRQAEATAQLEKSVRARLTGSGAVTARSE